MRTKMRNRYNQKGGEGIWRDSPCSANYVLQNPSIDRADKFNIGSIYYKDPVNKPKKIFTAFEKPDLLLTEFRRQIQEASHEKYYNASKNKISRQQQKSKAKSLTTTINSKFYSVPEKNEYKYDRNGVRSHMKGQYNVKEIQGRVLSARVNFGSSRRVDLSRPLNFFPGPGSYEHQILKNTARTLPNRRGTSEIKNHRMSEQLSARSNMKKSSQMQASAH